MMSKGSVAAEPKVEKEGPNQLKLQLKDSQELRRTPQAARNAQVGPHLKGGSRGGVNPLRPPRLLPMGMSSSFPDVNLG